MKRLILVMLSLAAGGLVAPVAMADPPVRSPVQAPTDFTLPGVCTFDVGIHVLVNKETQTTFGDGTTKITGAFKVKYTNLSDPSKTMIDNNNGVLAFTPNPDGSTSVKVTGQGAIFFLPGEIGPAGAFWLTNGNFQEVVDSFGNVVPGSMSYTGKTPLDVCTALA
jgi:hypothetical protein